MFISNLVIVSISTLFRLNIALHLLASNDAIIQPDLTLLPPFSPSAQLNAAIAKPTCFPNAQSASLNNNTLSTSNPNSAYVKDCLASLSSLLSWPTISYTAYRWQRMPPHSIPPSGVPTLTLQTWH